MDALIDIDIDLLALEVPVEQTTEFMTPLSNSAIEGIIKNQTIDSDLSQYLAFELDVNTNSPNTTDIFNVETIKFLDDFFTSISDDGLVSIKDEKVTSAENPIVFGDDDDRNIIDEIFTFGFRLLTGTYSDLDIEWDQWSDAYDQSLDDSDMDYDAGDVDDGWVEVSTKMGQALGLLANVIDIAAIVSLPDDKPQLEKLAASLNTISLALASGDIISSDTLIETLGDAYSIAINELSNASLIGLTAAIATGFGGPQTGAVAATFTAFTLFLADATGVTTEYYDRVGLQLATITYNLVVGGDGYNILDDLREFQRAIEDGIREFHDNPERVISGFTGVPDIGGMFDDDEYDDYYDDP